MLSLLACLLVLCSRGSANPVKRSVVVSVTRLGLPRLALLPVAAPAFVPVILLLLTTTATSIALGPCESFGGLVATTTTIL